MSRRATLWVLLTAAVLVAVVAGCGPKVIKIDGGGQSTSGGSASTGLAPGASVVVTGTVDSSGTDGDPSGAGGSSKTASGGAGARQTESLDVEAIDKQLDAMQAELDNLRMPSDAEFSGVDSAVY